MAEMPGDRNFRSTRWSVVLSTRDDGPDGRAAMDLLCATYWPPLYSWLRRRGHGAADSEDLIQGFFAELLERRVVLKADAARGRFRAFLLGALQNFVGHERDRAQALKRGGARKVLPLGCDALESQSRFEPSDPQTLEHHFARDWALAVLAAAIERVRREYADDGRFATFDRLRPFLAYDGNAGSQAEAAADLGVSEGAVAVAVHRLRSRLRTALRAEVATTVGDDGAVEAEIGELFRALDSRK